MGEVDLKTLKGDARLVRIAEMRAARITYPAIARDFGISRDRVIQLVGRAEYLERSRAEAPNAAALSARARHALYDLLCQRGKDLDAFDRDLPMLASKLTRRVLKDQPNIGVVTIAEIEQWLKTHGLQLVD